MQKAAFKTNDAGNTDLEVLLDLNRNYVRSALESDVHWYAENLSEDFHITAPDGALLDREEFLKRIANPYPGTHAEPVDVMVRILGDVAIVHSGYRDTKLNGERSYGRYTDIYERRNGRWLCVAAHFMRFSSPPKTER
jgi:ketosteroid isomerase-like protein